MSNNESSSTPDQSLLDVMSSIQNMDLSKVETSFPNLASGNVASTITAAAWDTSTDKPFLKIEYSLAQDWKTQAFNGEPSKPVPIGGRGSKFNQRIYVGNYEDKNTHETKVYGLDQIAKLFKAVFGKDTQQKANDEGCQNLIGQSVMVTLKFDPAPTGKDGKVFGPKTEVTGWVMRR